MNKRLKKVLLKKMGGKDTPQKRKELAESEAEKFKSLLSVPHEIEANVYEGFDPLLVSGDVVDTHFAKALNIILDFDDNTGTDAQFVEKAKEILIFFVGEWIDEL